MCLEVIPRHRLVRLSHTPELSVESPERLRIDPGYVPVSGHKGSSDICRPFNVTLKALEPSGSLQTQLFFFVDIPINQYILYVNEKLPQYIELKDFFG